MSALTYTARVERNYQPAELISQELSCIRGDLRADSGPAVGWVSLRHDEGTDDLDTKRVTGSYHFCELAGGHWEISWQPEAASSAQASATVYVSGSPNHIAVVDFVQEP
jgi:hypothetical protein